MMGTPQSPAQIVMMLATDDLTNKVSRLRNIGVEHYVVKPVRRAELIAAVTRTLARASAVTANGSFEPRAGLAPSSLVLQRPLNILLADDSPDNRALIEAYLKKTPYLLEQVENGQEAIDKFIARQFDLVLMDIQMPVVDGYEATVTIRAWELENSRRRTPIIALTASALEEAVKRTKAAGCDAHVTKPVKKATLLAAIRTAVEAEPADKVERDSSLVEGPCQTE
jgi:CheY-like chemotaxis protein